MALTRLAVVAAVTVSCVAGLRPRNGNGTAVHATTCNGKTYLYHELAGYGFVSGNLRDKYGDTIGGIGSAVALDQGSWERSGDGLTYKGLLWALPDRGWNTEGTLNFISRVHKFDITLTLQPEAAVENPASPNVDFSYRDTILFHGPDGQPTTSLDADGLGGLTYERFLPQLPAATYSGNGFGTDRTVGGNVSKHISVDGEGLVINQDGTFWVSDEYGPYVWLLASNGTILSVIRPPEAVIPKRNRSDSFSANSPPFYVNNGTGGDVYPADNPTGRQNNHGFEGLSTSPDGKMLYVLLQAAANQEGGLASQTERYTRFFTYDVSDKLSPTYVSEHVIPLPLYYDDTAKASKKAKVAAQSEMHALPNGQFLILARDSGAGNGRENRLSVYRHIDVFDVCNATDVKADYDCATCAVADKDGTLDPTIIPATYCSFLDFNVNSQLGRFGLHNGGEANGGLLNEKWESIALAPVKPGEDAGDEYFVISLSDNDFITQHGFLDFGQFQYADGSGHTLDSQALVFRVTLPS